MQCKWLKLRILFQYTYDITVFNNASVFRKTYNRLANQCINLWLKENYNLTAYTTVQFCSDNHEAEKIEYDILHYLFVVLLVLLIAVISSATFIDMHLNNQKSLVFYKKDLANISVGKAALLCFSLPRNWFRLTALPKTDLGRDLRFILAVRYST